VEERVVWVVGGARMWVEWCMVSACGRVVVCGHVWEDVHVRCGKCSDAV
jgi:hypothetical protein